MVGYLIIERIKDMPENNEEMEQSYQIENVGNISFKNANITVKNNISHISFDLVNGESQKISGQEIMITVKKDEKEVAYKYVIPDIEQGKSCNIKLKTTGDLTNAQEIKVEEIEL